MVYRWAGHYFRAGVLRVALGLQQLDRDAVECRPHIVTNAVRETARGIGNLSAGHNHMCIGFASYGVNEISGTKRNIDIRPLMFVEQRNVVCGKAQTKNTNVGIFKYESAVWLVGNGHSPLRLGRLNVEDSNEKSSGCEPSHPKHLADILVLSWKTAKREASTPG